MFVCVVLYDIFKIKAKDILDNFALGPLTPQHLAEMSYDQKVEVLSNADKIVGCPCCGSPKQPETDLSLSGSPCVAWSSDGKKKGRQDPSILCIVAWCVWHKHQRTKVLIHENVVNFDEQILYELMGSMYSIYRLNVHPSDCGFWFIRRARVYHILVRSASCFNFYFYSVEFH